MLCTDGQQVQILQFIFHGLMQLSKVEFCVFRAEPYIFAGYDFICVLHQYQVSAICMISRVTQEYSMSALR